MEQGSDLLVLIACKTTANAGHLELVFRVALGKHQEVVDVHGHRWERQRLDVVVLGRQGIAVARHSLAHTHFGTVFLRSHVGSTSTVMTSLVRAEDENLLLDGHSELPLSFQHRFDNETFIRLHESVVAQHRQIENRDFEMLSDTQGLGGASHHLAVLCPADDHIH